MKKSLLVLSLSGCSILFSPSEDKYNEDHNQNCNDNEDNDGNGLVDGEDPPCIPVCGDGVLGADEPCDDNNLVDGDGCSSLCIVEDGFLCRDVPSQCSTLCGDGIKAGAEACDDGNTQPRDGCGSLCHEEVCGNGVIDPINRDNLPDLESDEECDDGNLVNEDGCSDACLLEPGCSVTGAADARLGQNGHCYAVFTSSVPYPIAKSTCEQRGGHLLTITTQEELDLSLQMAIPVPHWIGAVQDRGDENVFFWTTYEDFSINLMIIDDEPNDACATLEGELWGDTDCLASAFPFCEIEEPILVPGAPTGADSFSLISLQSDANETRDIAAAAINSGVFTILENDGLGALSGRQEFSLGAGVNSEIAADIDGDGDEDIIVSHFGNKGVFLLENIGGGLFAQPSLLFLTRHNPTDLIFLDFDGNTGLDIALTTIDPSNQNAGSVEIFLRQNPGVSFAPEVVLSTGGDGAFELVAGEFSGTSGLDIAVVNHDSDTVAILAGPEFVAEITLVVCDGPFSLGLGSLSPGRPADLATACDSGEGGAALIATGLQPNVTLLPTLGQSQVARLGDLNADGKDELVVSQPGSGQLSVFLNIDGEIAAENPTIYNLGGAPGEMVIDDFNGDGLHDVAVANPAKQTIDMLLNRGATLLLAPTN